MTDAQAVPDWFRDTLAAPVTDGTCISNGCEIAYRHWGNPSNPGVVLVHGGKAQSHWWDHVGPLLAKNCSVSAHDISGHGDSAYRKNYSWEDWAQEALDVASLTSDSPSVIIGHSHGGRIAAKAAAEAGDGVAGLILVDSSIGPTWAEGVVRAGRPMHTPGPSRVYATEEEARSRFRLWPSQPSALPYALDNVARHSIKKVEGGWTWKVDPTAFGPENRFRAQDIGGETICKVQGPMAMLRGEHGRVNENCGPWFSETLGRPVPVVEITDAYHSVMMDQPLALVSAIRALLAQWGHFGSLDSLPS